MLENDKEFILNIDAAMESARQAQDLQSILDAAERTKRKVVACTEWSDPEAIKDRHKRIAMEAVAALERGKAMARDLPPVVIPDPLPKELRGQSRSTIEAMLRSGWRPGTDDGPIIQAPKADSSFKIKAFGAKGSKL